MKIKHKRKSRMRTENFEIVHFSVHFSCKPDVAASELKKRFDNARKKKSTRR